MALLSLDGTFKIFDGNFGIDQIIQKSAIVWFILLNGSVSLENHGSEQIKILFWGFNLFIFLANFFKVIFDRYFFFVS